MSTIKVFALICCLLQLHLSIAYTNRAPVAPSLRNLPPFQDYNDAYDDDLDDWFYNKGRIIGGYPTSILNFPYQVSLQHNNAHICGGSIIQRHIIITAAHCIEEPTHTSAYTVRIGSTRHAVGGQLFSVQRIIKHEGYSSATYNYDVALIELAMPVAFSERAQAIQLPKVHVALPMAQRLYVSGWGLTSESGSVADTLHYVAVRVIKQEVCVRNYENVVPVTAEMFCAGFNTGGKDSCQGDSGGPLVGYADEKGAVLYGIVSWGVGCAQKNYPGVYTNVAVMRPWIDAKLAELGSKKLNGSEQL